MNEKPICFLICYCKEYHCIWSGRCLCLCLLFRCLCLLSMIKSGFDEDDEREVIHGRDEWGRVVVRCHQCRYLEWTRRCCSMSSMEVFRVERRELESHNSDICYSMSTGMFLVFILYSYLWVNQFSCPSSITHTFIFFAISSKVPSSSSLLYRANYLYITLVIVPISYSLRKRIMTAQDQFHII